MLQKARHYQSDAVKCTFSTSAEVKSKQPLFDKEQLSEWNDWISDHGASHVTNKVHVTEKSNCRGNQPHVPVMVEEVKDIFGELQPKVSERLKSI